MIESSVKTRIETYGGYLLLSRVREPDTVIYMWKATYYNFDNKEISSTIGNNQVLDLLRESYQKGFFPDGELEKIFKVIEKVKKSIANRKKFKYI